MSTMSTTAAEDTGIIHRVVIDLETASTANNAAIVAVGFCVVRHIGINPPTIGHPMATYISLASCEAAGLDVDIDTMEWWSKQDPALRNQVFGGTVSGREVLLDIADYIKELKSTGKVYVYGYGANFDITILEEAFDAFDVQIPWTYKEVRCLRTLADLLPTDERDDFKSTKPHHPAHDAFAEAQLLTRVIEHLASKGITLP